MSDGCGRLHQQERRPSLRGPAPAACTLRMVLVGSRSDGFYRCVK